MSWRMIAMHDNLRNLGLDTLEVVNLRIMGNIHKPTEGSIAAPFRRASSALRSLRLLELQYEVIDRTRRLLR
jgi:hypothetical protein